MYELAFHEDGSEQVVPIRPAGVVMGRSPDCDVVIKDFGVSRRHAEVVVDGEKCRLVDLRSKNGTQVNGVRVPEALLADGDQILLGKFLVSFRKTLDEKVVLDEEKPMLKEAGTIIRSVGELSKFFLDEKPPKDETKSRALSPKDEDELAKINRVLRSLSELANALISAQPEEVPARVMDAVFEHIPADRGFLMLYDDEGNLKPRVVHHRHGDDEKITISKTIADRVVQDRVAILTSDAQVDPRFASGDSIRFHGIRSAMCAPLWKGDAVIGIIHVDSPMQTKTFTPDDLELLSALSNYAAVAIEQASLNKKVQEERVARERLEKYFSPNVATRILSEGEKEVQELELSVLFADIVGFTPMAEKMSPSSVSKLLNEYFSRMEEPIFEHEGTLDKFIGDCIMAVFGAPYPQEGSRPAGGASGSRYAPAAARAQHRARWQCPHPNADGYPQRPGGVGADRLRKTPGVHRAWRHCQHRFAHRVHDREGGANRHWRAYPRSREGQFRNDRSRRGDAEGQEQDRSGLRSGIGENPLTSPTWISE